ncbi:hypothetical protein FCM35_KLT18873 [Carex littledalei]|uniref:Uncharacterized protein n=1 Tax=Carex littledalei TaxID=544730 RepID=A0A833R7W5_9POAL|nr:hypothetical protein FCM35_KLT18873 [Carex littledalei]
MKHRLPNLYSFAEDSNITLKQMFLQQGRTNIFRPNLSVQAQQELYTLHVQLAQINLRDGVKVDLLWKWTATGQFTVKSAYTSLKGGKREF